MKLSVIIPTKDRKQIFEKTLNAALKATSHILCEIIIINDAIAEIPSLPQWDNVFLFQNQKKGVAAARNLGFAKSSGDLLLFLDNDIIISRASVDHIIQLHALHPNACFNLNWEYTDETLKKISTIPFGRYLHACNLTSFKGWYNDSTWKDNALFKSKSVASFHLSIARVDFEKSGGYNEQFPFAGFEDYDFPARLKKVAVDFYIDTRVTVYHNEVDRLLIDNWLISQENRAVTRKKAVLLGYAELTLHYNPIKSILLKSVLLAERWLIRALNALPTAIFFDGIFFEIISIVQAARIYRGYTSHNEY